MNTLKRAICLIAVDEDVEPEVTKTKKSPRGTIITGEDLYQKIKNVVEEKQAQRINGMLMDLFSASAVVKVADNLNEQNRARFLALPLVKIVNMAFQMLK